MVISVAFADASATNTPDNQQRKQQRHGLCTALRFDTTAQRWIHCQNKQHNRGRRKKCLDCLAISDDLNERLIAQGFCKCKRDHPVGRGCPDRLLREGRLHLITQEQSDWYWRQILTNYGKIDPYGPLPLTAGQMGYMVRCVKLFRSFCSIAPPSLASIQSAFRELRTTSTMSRRQRDWMIVAVTIQFSMWNDPELDLKDKAKIARSQAIMGGMEAARLAGRPPGRPRRQK